MGAVVRLPGRRRGLAPLILFGLLAGGMVAFFWARYLVGRLNGDVPGAAVASEPFPGPASGAAATLPPLDPAPAPAPATPTPSPPGATAPGALAGLAAEAKAAHLAFVAAASSGDPAAVEAARLRLAAAEKAYREALGGP